MDLLTQVSPQEDLPQFSKNNFFWGVVRGRHWVKDRKNKIEEGLTRLRLELYFILFCVFNSGTVIQMDYSRINQGITGSTIIRIIY